MLEGSVSGGYTQSDVITTSILTLLLCLILPKQCKHDNLQICVLEGETCDIISSVDGTPEVLKAVYVGVHAAVLDALLFASPVQPRAPSADGKQDAFKAAHSGVHDALGKHEANCVVVCVTCPAKSSKCWNSGNRPAAGVLSCVRGMLTASMTRGRSACLWVPTKPLG